MKTIVFQDNFAYIYLNKEIYSKNSILKTIETYQEFTKSQIGELGKYFTLKIQSINNDFELKIIAKEMLNYILSEERKSR